MLCAAATCIKYVYIQEEYIHINSIVFNDQRFRHYVMTKIKLNWIIACLFGTKSLNDINDIYFKIRNLPTKSRFVAMRCVNLFTCALCYGTLFVPRKRGTFASNFLYGFINFKFRKRKNKNKKKLILIWRTIWQRLFVYL